MFLNHFTNTFTQSLAEKGNPTASYLCFTPNGCKGRRIKSNLTNINAVFCDFDYKPKEGEPTGSAKPDFKQFLLDLDELPTPTFIVESGNGWHLYWLLEKSITVTDENRDELVKNIEGIHRYLHQDYGSDSGAIDVLRLMRAPGHLHRKNPETPVPVEVVVDNDDTRYTLDDLMAAMPPVYEEEVTIDEEANGDTLDYDIRQAAIDAWAERGDEVSFDSFGRLIWNGQQTGTFIGRHGNRNYIATTSDEYPYKGNPTTYVAGVLGISTKEAYKWLVDRYGELKSELGDSSLDWSKLMSVVKNKGKDNEYVEYLANDENILYILDHHKVAKWDDFKNKPYLRLNGEWIVRDDGRDGELYSWLVRKYPFLAKVTLQKLGSLITAAQYRNRYDSAINYLESLTWDGTPRIDDWLHTVFHVENTEFNQTIGKNWIMGMVSRILVPGNKFDHGLIIQGGQGVGKSTAFLVLAGEGNHVEFIDLKLKEMQQDIQGKLIAEFAEAAIFSKHDQESIKSIVSRQTDTFRIPYERSARDFPRRCVYAVTANNDNLLKDQTGERRWWPVILPEDMRVYPPQRKANIDWLKENRNQLLAEAAHRFKQGEDYWSVSEDELEKHQDSIRSTEQDEELFWGWYHLIGEHRRESGVTSREAYVGAYKRDARGEPLDIASVSIKKADEMRVARILTRMGLSKRKVGKINKWFPTERYKPLKVDTKTKEF